MVVSLYLLEDGRDIRIGGDHGVVHLFLVRLHLLMELLAFGLKVRIRLDGRVVSRLEFRFLRRGQVRAPMMTSGRTIRRGGIGLGPGRAREGKTYRE